MKGRCTKVAMEHVECCGTTNITTTGYRRPGPCARSALTAPRPVECGRYSTTRSRGRKPARRAPSCRARCRERPRREGDGEARDRPSCHTRHVADVVKTCCYSRYATGSCDPPPVASPLAQQSRPCNRRGGRASPEPLRLASPPCASPASSSFGLSSACSWLLRLSSRRCRASWRAPGLAVQIVTASANQGRIRSQVALARRGLRGRRSRWVGSGARRSRRWLGRGRQLVQALKVRRHAATLDEPSVSRDVARGS